MVKLGALLTLVAPSAATASLAARLHDADFFERSWGQEVAHLRADDASAFDASPRDAQVADGGGGLLLWPSLSFVWLPS